MTKPGFFVPEVIQTSEMDCGPAALKALLGGYGIHVSYGRLREACQTQVDGTSIDTIEDVAVQLGLAAEQLMLPADHLPLPEAGALPALAVVVMPNGLTHFVVVWNMVGPLVQLMDPGRGRRWTTWERFAQELYIHEFPVASTALREWAGSEGFLAPLRRRMRDLGMKPAPIDALIERACAEESWVALGALDASVRMMTDIVRAGGMTRGQQAADVVTALFENGGAEVPGLFWFARPAPAEMGEGMLIMRGALVIHTSDAGAVSTDVTDTEATPAVQLPPELVAALNEPPAQPEREIWRALKPDGWLIPAIVVLALLMATLGVSVEAALLQALMRSTSDLVLVDQRWSAAAALVIFVVALFALEVPLSAAIQRIGRRLEARLRIAFLEKIPRLGDRYFHSRLVSDMANRAHSLAALRQLPALAVSFLRQLFQIILTSAGVLYLDPANAPAAIAFSLLFVLATYFANPILEENSLRVGTLGGALTRFYLDALQGLIPLKTHGAERPLRREHEGMLTDWMRASFGAARASMYVQAVGALLYALFAISMVYSVVGRGGSTQSVLLLFYWTLNLPALAQGISQTIQSYPDTRNMILRILEPLGAADANGDAGASGAETPAAMPTPPTGVEVEFDNVTIKAGGHVILSDINLKIAAGEHIAVVGPSGAGKSSLAGILLGWHTASTGQTRVDGAVLDGARLTALRQETAWVDPAVQLWNRSLIDNLQYGNDTNAALSPLITRAELYDVLARLPEGLQTDLGESGGLVSGGEGQRVRLGRAMSRSTARLVILDEPLRGLDRAMRRTLLARARALWRGATLICITHDVGETQTFDRVVVLENGMIVEDAPPGVLAAQHDSRYNALLAGEEAVRRGLWEGTIWQHLRVADGRVTEEEQRRTVED